METNLLELQQVGKAVDSATDELAKKLSELQLVCSGGGLAEVSFD